MKYLTVTPWRAIAAFAMILLVAITSWWFYLSHQQYNLIKSIEDVGGRVSYPRADRFALNSPWKRVESVELQCPPARDADLANVGKLPGLTNVSLQGEFTSDGIKCLSKACDLKQLILDNVPISSAEASALKSLTPLQSLCLIGISANTEAIKNASSLPNIKDIRLVRSDLHSLDLSRIKYFTNLEHLSIIRSSNDAYRISVKELSHLGSISSIESLEFMIVDLDESGLHHLKDLSRLREISIVAKDTTIPSLDFISDPLIMDSLFLGAVQLGHAFPEELERFKNIKKLNLSGTDTNASYMPYISKLTSLESLVVSHTAITSSDIQALQWLSSLRYLELGPGVDKAAVLSLKKNLTECTIKLLYPDGSDIIIY